MSRIESSKVKARRVFAELELAFSTNAKTVQGGGHPLGALEELLSPVAILQHLGTSAKIRRWLGTVKAAAAVNRDLPGIPAEERRENAKRFDLLEERLLYQLRGTSRAEEILAVSGWQFDPEENILKAKMVKGQPGNRPEIFLLRCIEAAADNFRKLKGEPLREAIAEELWLYFPGDTLDKGPRGNIARALENYRRK